MKYRLTLRLGDHLIGFLIPEDAADAIRRAEAEAEPDDLYIVKCDMIPETQDVLDESTLQDDLGQPISIDDLPGGTA
jgi:hypothetical protein